jgi:hypothetical protein
VVPVVGEMLDAAEIENARRTGRDFYGEEISPELLAGLTAAGYLIPNALERPAKALAKGLRKIMPSREFKSSIDWAAWNPETPNHPELMDEYLDIEKRTKQDGTWMKNPDGTKFEGSPEQFVQQQSSYYKKAFPEGADKLYRGVATGDNVIQSNFRNPDIDYDMEDVVFTSQQRNQADSYAGGVETITPLNRTEMRGGMFELLTPRSSNTIELDTSGTRFTNVDINTSKEEARKTMDGYIAEVRARKERYLNEIAEGSTPPDVIRDRIRIYDREVKQVEDLKGGLDKLYETYNPAEAKAFWEALKADAGHDTFLDTDEIAWYLTQTDYDRLIMRNLDDEGIGDVNIIANKAGNYLKSAVGNVGFFDLTNPDVFKAMIPILGLSTAIAVKAKQQEIKQS